MLKFDKFAHFPEGTDQHITHPAEAKPGIHVFPDKLYVITCLENPLRWRSRYANYWQFAKHVEQAGAQLITVESALGDRDFEVTDSSNPWHVQVRIQDELFRKENLQNRGARRLPLSAKYVAFIDADVTFARPDWCQEALHLLQHYDVIQMFTSFSDVGPDFKIMGMARSFMWNFSNEEGQFSGQSYYDTQTAKTTKWSGAPGLAWAYKVSALDTLGGLMDKAILGGADAHMAFGLVAKDDMAKLHLEYQFGSNEYRRYISNWQANAGRLQMNVGYMEGSLLHFWHGPKANRGYASRHKILEKYQFDPHGDVIYDHQGIIRLRGNKIGMRDEIRAYFRQRQEDDFNLPSKK